MRPISLDSTYSLLREGYSWIQLRREHYGSDVFRDRLAGHEVNCMRGEEAARLFYDSTSLPTCGPRGPAAQIAAR